MLLQIRDHHFWLNDQKIFLLSGEIHYFRIPAEGWDHHLSAARQAGLHAVSTYVPWDWHEPSEGFFDLDGKTHPQRNLTGWIEKCHEHGLFCILKPGPFILAEYRRAGLPFWLIDQYGDQIKIRKRNGEILQSDWVNLFHPLFEEHYTRWYDHIMPLISRYETIKDGPILMIQLCNEIGVFSWLAHQADYGYGIRERFSEFLRVQFESIEELNDLWETSYESFDQVELPPDGWLSYQSKGDRSRDYYWHRFWRSIYREYLIKLSGMARERGVTVPFYHNLPGWIYGSGYEFPLNISMYDELYGHRSEILFGVDHIPEFQSYRNMHDDRVINGITAAMQPGKPLFAAEFQCGSREYHVVPGPRELELFYKASIANGLTGWNYYVFSQGKNQPRKGYSGDTFYWYAALHNDGQPTSTFPVVSRTNRLIKTLESVILNSSPAADIGILFYTHYYATELYRPETGASQLIFNYADIRRPAYFDGLLKALHWLNVEYDMINLTDTTPEELLKYKQIWAFATDEMNARDQQTLADFLYSGGNLVLFPGIPDREMNQRPCTILKDAAGLNPVGIETIDSPLVDLLDLKDIKCANPQVILHPKSEKDGQIVARTLRGSPCGIMKKVGRGNLLYLGTWLGFDTESHRQAYLQLLLLSGARLQHATSSNDSITIRQRFTPAGEGLLFIANYFNEPQKVRISYKHPQTDELLAIPFSDEFLTWPSLTAVLTPVALKLTPQLQLLHLTSDLLHIESNNHQITLTLYGDPQLAGEILLENPTDLMVTATSSVPLDITSFPNWRKTLIRYQHPQGNSFHIILSLYSSQTKSPDQPIT